jgi:hypothetical protein
MAHDESIIPTTLLFSFPVEVSGHDEAGHYSLISSITRLMSPLLVASRGCAIPCFMVSPRYFRFSLFGFPLLVTSA